MARTKQTQQKSIHDTEAAVKQAEQESEEDSSSSEDPKETEKATATIEALESLGANCLYDMVQGSHDTNRIWSITYLDAALEQKITLLAFEICARLHWELTGAQWFILVGLRHMLYAHFMGSEEKLPETITEWPGLMKKWNGLKFDHKKLESASLLTLYKQYADCIVSDFDDMEEVKEHIVFALSSWYNSTLLNVGPMDLNVLANRLASGLEDYHSENVFYVTPITNALVADIVLHVQPQPKLKAPAQNGKVGDIISVAHKIGVDGREVRFYLLKADMKGALLRKNGVTLHETNTIHPIDPSTVLNWKVESRVEGMTVHRVTMVEQNAQGLLLLKAFAVEGNVVAEFNGDYEEPRVVYYAVNYSLRADRLVEYGRWFQRTGRTSTVEPARVLCWNVNCIKTDDSRFVIYPDEQKIQEAKLSKPVKSRGRSASPKRKENVKTEAVAGNVIATYSIGYYNMVEVRFYLLNAELKGILLTEQYQKFIQRAQIDSIDPDKVLSWNVVAEKCANGEFTISRSEQLRHVEKAPKTKVHGSVFSDTVQSTIGGVISVFGTTRTNKPEVWYYRFEQDSKGTRLRKKGRWLRATKAVDVINPATVLNWGVVVKKSGEGEYEITSSELKVQEEQLALSLAQNQSILVE